VIIDYSGKCQTEDSPGVHNPLLDGALQPHLASSVPGQAEHVHAETAKLSPGGYSIENCWLLELRVALQLWNREMFPETSAMAPFEEKSLTSRLDQARPFQGFYAAVGFLKL
jgi:hypothetical protein